MKDQWIIVRNWERFQHYKDRQPPWIKNYTELMSDDAYRSLPLGTRGVLHGLWMEYARGRRLLRGDSRSVSRALGQRVLTAQLETLNQAGFITLTASKPDASDTRVGEEQEEEKEKEQSSSSTEDPKIDPDDLPFEQELAAARLLKAIGAPDSNGTRATLETYRLPPAAWYAAAEELERMGNVIVDRGAYAGQMFKTWKEDGRYATSAS